MFGKTFRFRNRRGATLAVVAVSLVALLSIMALAIDMGMMYSARNEAQRVADAAALAGASAFLDPQYQPASLAVAPARARAIEYLNQNSVLTRYVDENEAQIDIDHIRRRVTVTVRREEIVTWFAKVFGINLVAVQASATAEASDAGAAKCVVPMAMQDTWFEAGDVRPGPDDRFAGNPDPPPSDCRGTSVDCYKPANPIGDLSASGYGRDISDNGADLLMKTQRPATGNDETLAQPGPGEFLTWNERPDEEMARCATGGGDDPYSPSFIFRNSICGCNNNSYPIGEPIMDWRNPAKSAWHTGNVVGQVADGIDAIFRQAAQSPWGRLGWSAFQAAGAPVGHPQVVKVGMIAPLPPPPPGTQNWTSANMPPLVFTNFVYVFVEDYLVDRPNQQVQLMGKFMYPAPGEAGETTGSLTRYLRLIK